MAEQTNGKRSPEEIRHEIDATRGRMDQTLSVLEQRLSPQHLKEQAADTIRERTVGRVSEFTDNATESLKGAGTDVFETIKDHPLPAAMAFIGLGWLFMESRNENRRAMRASRYPQTGQFRNQYGGGYGAGRAGYGGPTGGYNSEYRYYDPNYTGNYSNEQSGVQDRARQMAGQVQDTAQHVTGQVQDKAQQVTGQVQDTAQHVADQAQQVAGQVQDKAQQFAGQAQDQVQQLAGTAQEQAYRVRSKLEDLMDENPFLIGAAALALGAAIGMSLPSTAKENQLMGEARDSLMDRAQDVAQDTMQKAQQVAQRAGDAAKDAAKDEAQRQNLTTGTGM